MPNFAFIVSPHVLTARPRKRIYFPRQWEANRTKQLFFATESRCYIGRTRVNLPSFENQHQYVGLSVKHINNVELIYDAELCNLNYVFLPKVFVHKRESSGSTRDKGGFGFLHSMVTNCNASWTDVLIN